MAETAMGTPGDRDDFAKLQEEIQALKSTVADLGDQLKSATEQQGEELRRMAGSKMDELGERLQSFGRTVADQGRSSFEGAQRQISERPMESVLIAFGLGIIVSFLLGRR